MYVVNPILTNCIIIYTVVRDTFASGVTVRGNVRWHQFRTAEPSEPLTTSSDPLFDFENWVGQHFLFFFIECISRAIRDPIGLQRHTIVWVYLILGLRPVDVLVAKSGFRP